MVAELQTTDAAAIDWQPAGPAEVPLPTLRLLARVPRVGDRPWPSGQVPPDKRTHADRAGDFATTKTPKADSQVGAALAMAAGRAAPLGIPAGMRLHADLATRLCAFHAAIKPHAGVIVALALLGSAGLLYWLVTGSAANPRQPQQHIGQDMLGHHSHEPDASLGSAPVWSAPGSRPDVTEDSVSESEASQRDLVRGSAEAVAGNATADIAPTPATVPTVKVAATGIPCVKYVPAVSVPPANGPPTVVETAPGSSFQATETRFAGTPGTPASTGTSDASVGPVAATHAETPAGGNLAPQPSPSPSIQSYPKTDYGPFNFALGDTGGKEGSQSPMVARGPETSRTGQLPR